MNKKTVLAAALGAVVVAGWAGATYVTGQKLKTALVAQAEGWKAQPGQPQPAFRVTDVQYRAGLLGATRTLTLAIGCGAETTPLTWRDDIRHGPLPGFAGFGAARIDSSLVLSAEQQAQLKKLLGDAQTQLSLRTLVAYNGGYKTQLEVPALRIKSPEGGDFEFKGASAWVQVRADGGARYEASLPSYAVSAPGQGPAPGMRFVVTDAKLQGEGYAPMWWALSGKGSGSMAAMNFETVAADGQRKPMFTLKNMKYTQDGGIAGGLYQASGSLQAQGQIGSLPLDAVTMKFSLKQLHAQSYAALMGALMNTGCPSKDPAADPMAALQPMLAPLKELLPQNPQISMDELSVTLGGQTAKMSYQLGFNGITAAETEGAALMPALMQKMALRMGVEAPVALLPKLGEALGQPLPPELIDQQLAQAEGQGFIVRTGDSISAKFELREGAALVNGKPIAVPGLPGQGAAPAAR
ncbi:YdgA family protein [Rubrivivax rivuli]|nr:DUF945 family protein [Rubrivivax rivuli]